MKTYYVIKADLENHSNCIDAEQGVYVDKTLSNYASLRYAKRFASREDAQRHITESWEIVEEVK